ELPEAAAVNRAEALPATIWLEGLAVTTGGVFTVRVAAEVTAEPQVFVNTARYLLPFLENVTELSVRIVPVAPGMSANGPPFVETCHRMVGEGLPEATALNEMLPPAQMD